MNVPRKPILAIDFDGVIHGYQSGWKGAGIIPDPPVPGAIDFLVSVHPHFNIAIVSSRCREPGGPGAIKDYLARHGIEPGYLYPTNDPRDRHWTEWENGAILITSIKPPAILTIDDRGWTFDGTFPTADQIKAFRTWQKQDV